MPEKKIPVVDAHLHLDPDGRGVEAAREFERSGGTAFVLVHKPYHSVPCRNIDDFSKSFEITVSLARKVREETGLKVAVALSPHPAELTTLARETDLRKATELMSDALSLCAKLVREKKACALGEIGRPHYPVAQDVWDASNRLLREGLTYARELGCAAVLHTESATPEVFRELATMAGETGIPLDRVVKHFSPPVIRVEENCGLFPSVLAGKDAVEKALSQGTRFLLETDYLDDVRRPGAVLGPATVPRRTMALLKSGQMTEEQLYIIHQDNPRKVFGDDLF